MTTVLDEVAVLCGCPKYLRIDNGAELTSKAMQQWAEEQDVELLFIQQGKPRQNAYIESFNVRVRDELLNTHWFRTIAQARYFGSSWMHRYNTERSHSPLRYRTPEEFVASTKLPGPHRNQWPHDGAHPNSIAMALIPTADLER